MNPIQWLMVSAAVGAVLGLIACARSGKGFAGMLAGGFAGAVGWLVYRVVLLALVQGVLASFPGLGERVPGPLGHLPGALVLTPSWMYVLALVAGLRAFVSCFGVLTERLHAGAEPRVEGAPTVVRPSDPAAPAPSAGESVVP